MAEVLPVLRETEIRPAELMAEQALRYQADIDWLMTESERFIEVACPACTAQHREPWGTKYGLSYVRCTGCETVYVSPRPDPDLLRSYYSSSQNYEYWNRVVFPASEGARREKIFRPRASRVAEIVKRLGVQAGTLVDVGAGFGTFCQEVAALGLFQRVVALEPEPNLAETCREKGLEVVEATVEDASFAEASYDVVTNFEVIEHLFEPSAFVARCAQLIRPGGLFIVTCPNVKGFDIATLRERANAVDPEHLNYFHPDSLAQLLERSGFDVVERQTPGRLDAELVRTKILDGEFDVSEQPFLRRVLIEEWDRVGGPFQDFLSENELSSNMWLVARRQAG